MTSSSPWVTATPAVVAAARVTIIYFLLYYAFLMFQTYSKLFILARERRSKKGHGIDWRVVLGLERYNYLDPELSKIKYGGDDGSGSRDPLSILGDRIVGNTLEQMMPFLVGLWGSAATASGGDESAGSIYCLGTIYILSRLFYPWCFSKGSPFILISTVPGYMVIWWQLITAAMALQSQPTAR